MKNRLYYGDNLDVLRRHIPDDCVDLIYLDPPFNSNANYNVLFAEQDGSQSAAQIRAFEDTWRWDEAAVRAYQETVEAGGNVARALKAMRDLLGDNTMTAYLSMMAPRLVELHRVLKGTGLLYLHCDPTASHYLKVLLDAVFGAMNFRNEIIWCYAGGGIPRRDFPRKHDVILRYTKSGEYYHQHIYREYSPGTLQRGRTKVKGKYFEKGLRVEGTPVNDWWVDVAKITSPTDPEKLGYPTQKPVALLERIITASSKPGDLVLDPFCGCGTTIDAAQRLDRRWIGIDITHLAIGLMKHRLQHVFPRGVEYEVWGEPTTIEDAKALARHDRYQFEWWALGQVGARRNDRKGADDGIDGRIYFHDASSKTRQVVLQVKSGNLTLSAVRDFARVIEREGADIGVLLTMNPPTAKMRVEAAGMGSYASPWGTHQRYQILPIEQVLSGAKIDMPPIGQTNKTFKRAQRYRRPIEQPTLGDT